MCGAKPKKVVPQQIMVPNHKLLKWTGYWPGDTHPISVKEIVQCVIRLIMAIVLVLIPEGFFAYQNLDDMLEVSHCISEALSLVLAFLKMWLVLWYRSRLHSLIVDIKSNWEICKSEYNTEEWLEVCKFTEKQSKYLTYIYTGMYVGFGMNFCINPVLVTIVQSYVTNTTLTPASIPMPIKLGYPFDIYGNFFAVSAAHISGDVGVFTTISFMAAFDAFTLTMMNYTATFFQLVNVKLNNLHKKYNTREEMQQNIMKDLSDIIKHHTKAIEFVNRLEEVSNVYMIIQYISSTFLLCVVGFQLSVFLENIYQFFRISTYCLCLNMQLFTFSWFGSKIMEESANVANSAYGCQWYDKPLKFQKCMVLIMGRAQRPVGISAAKFYLISLESFSKVLSASLSYFTLLQTVYED